MKKSIILILLTMVALNAKVESKLTKTQKEEIVEDYNRYLMDKNTKVSKNISKNFKFYLNGEKVYEGLTKFKEDIKLLKEWTRKIDIQIKTLFEEEDKIMVGVSQNYDFYISKNKEGDKIGSVSGLKRILQIFKIKKENGIYKIVEIREITPNTKGDYIKKWKK